MDACRRLIIQAQDFGDYIRAADSRLYNVTIELLKQPAIKKRTVGKLHLYTSFLI